MLSKSHTKYITSLHHKKFRDEHNVFIAEGPKVVNELLGEPGMVCKEIFSTVDWAKPSHITVSPITIESFELEKISGLNTPNQVLAIFEKVQSATPKLNGAISLALDGIQDPGNLGTIIRIADWFGVKNILCSSDCADMYNPKVVQSTMGSLARVNIFYEELEKILRDTPVNKFAAALNGQSVKNLKIKEGVIIIGNESKGIRDEIFALADEKITIGKIGRAESLNAAVAAGIILSHL